MLSVTGLLTLVVRDTVAFAPVLVIHLAAVTASISISGPASRLRDPAVLATAADAVRATARQISARLGAPETALCADAP